MRGYFLFVLVLLSACAASSKSVSATPIPGESSITSNHSNIASSTFEATPELTTVPAQSNLVSPTVPLTSQMTLEAQATLDASNPPVEPIPVLPTAPLPLRLTAVAIARATPITLEIYNKGEPIPFYVNGKINYCLGANRAPYSIFQITDTGEREVALTHSCIGLFGSGVDQYCVNDVIKTTNAGHCSDVIICGVASIDEAYIWDQQEFVTITENCTGEEITREVKQQIPEGRYKITVDIQQNDQVVTKVIREFMVIE